MEVLAIIPVRGGSKGIPGKNIKPLAGKPLVAYTIEAAHNSKYITRTVVSTESSKIKDVCLALGAEVIDRPQELARDETKTAPVLLQVVESLGKQGYKPDVVVLLQATCPLRDGKETGATYIIKTDVMKEVKDFIGKKPEVYTGGRCVDIDTEQDFETAAKVIEQLRKKECGAKDG